MFLYWDLIRTIVLILENIQYAHIYALRMALISIIFINIFKIGWNLPILSSIKFCKKWKCQFLIMVHFANINSANYKLRSHFSNAFLWHLFSEWTRRLECSSSFATSISYDEVRVIKVMSISASRIKVA